jgi:hypothetical protein
MVMCFYCKLAGEMGGFHLVTQSLHIVFKFEGVSNLRSDGVYWGKSLAERGGFEPPIRLLTV